MEPFDRRVLDRPVHSLDLAVRPWVVGLGQPVLDAVGLADHVEAHWPRIDGVLVPRLLCELNTVFRQNRMDLVRHGLEQVLQELPGGLSVSRFNELSNCELGSSVDAHKEIELAFSRLHLGDVDMEGPDGVALELLAPGLVAFDIRQSRDPMSLQTPVQR